MSNHNDGPPSGRDERFANIFATNGAHYFHLAETQGAYPGGAFTQLMANMTFLLRDAYGVNRQFCLVVPHEPLPEVYQEFTDYFIFENHDGTDSVATQDIITEREAASETIGTFLYHLRLAAANLPPGKGNEILVEKAAPGRFIVAFRDYRALTYALGMLAAQRGYETGIYPLSREGLRPSQIFGLRADNRYGPHVSGDIRAFLNTKPGDETALPPLPFSLKDIADRLNAGRQALAVPPFRAAPLAEFAPIEH